MLVEHQLDAVARARRVIERCGGVILADEPGLGKSFVAAQLASDEERRGVAIELIVPASLVGQWRETLDQFDVKSARVLTHDGIVSDSSEPVPVPRLIIVDEAHAFRNPDTQRYDALARRSVGARVLLVTATPVCNSARDLESLLNLIVADDSLMPLGVPSIDLAFNTVDREALGRIVGELVIRRGRDVLPDALRFGALDPRVIRFDVFTAGGRIDRLIETLRFPLIVESAILRQFLWRRLESSEAALLESVRRQRRFYERALECLASGRALPKREYRRAFAHEEDAAAVQQFLFWEMFAADGAAADGQEIEAEMQRLDELRAVLTSSEGGKRLLFVDLCAKTPEPILAFTGWAATAADLFESVRSVRSAAVATGRDRRRAAEAIASFASGAADVLIATDLAAEGLNLQRAGVVVHYDMPWNPVRVDQRNGRANRIGQVRDRVAAIYFLPCDDRAGVFRVVSRKNVTRNRLLRHATPGAGESVAALPRPRVTPTAAAVRFAAACERRGRPIPEELARRHKAGIERLLLALGNVESGERALRRAGELLALEPWGRPGLL